MCSEPSPHLCRLLLQQVLKITVYAVVVLTGRWRDGKWSTCTCGVIFCAICCRAKLFTVAPNFACPSVVVQVMAGVHCNVVNCAYNSCCQMGMYLRNLAVCLQGQLISGCSLPSAVLLCSLACMLACCGARACGGALTASCLDSCDMLSRYYWCCKTAES